MKYIKGVLNTMHSVFTKL